MCLLTLIPDGVTPDMGRFKEASRSNPDGFGFAILEKSSIITFHSMKFEEMSNQFTDLRSKHPGPAMAHFRWATHGEKTALNCQPIPIGDDPTTVMGHNGVMSVNRKFTDLRSDSRVFAEETLPMLGGVTLFDDKKYVKLFEMWAGTNKLVFLSNNPEAKDYWYIINEADGHWDQDVWWSNDSYEYRAPTLYKDYYSRDYAMGGDKYGLKAPTAQETLDRMEEEQLEAYESQFDTSDDVQYKILSYTESIDDNHFEISCYYCGHQEVIDNTVLVTECTACLACLYCGYEACGCFDSIER